MSGHELQEDIEEIRTGVLHQQVEVLPALQDLWEDGAEDVAAARTKLRVANSTKRNLLDAIAKENNQAQYYQMRINQEKLLLAKAEKEQIALNTAINNERKIYIENIDKFKTFSDKLSEEFRQHPDNYKTENLMENIKKKVANEQSIQSEMRDIESMISSMRQVIMKPKEDEQMKESIEEIVKDYGPLDKTIFMLKLKNKEMITTAEQLTQEIAQLKMKGFDNIYPVAKN